MTVQKKPLIPVFQVRGKRNRLSVGGKIAVATLVKRHSRLLIMLGVPGCRKADGLAYVLSDRVNYLPNLMRGSLTWDQGTEVARHAQQTVAADLPVYFAQSYTRWKGSSNKNTNGLIREYLPKASN